MDSAAYIKRQNKIRFESFSYIFSYYQFNCTLHYLQLSKFLLRPWKEFGSQKHKNCSKTTIEKLVCFVQIKKHFVLTKTSELSTL